jgi:hypothetical protein
MCLPDLEFQFVNPTTQVALFSFCPESCSSINNITWNIYFGIMNSSSNFTQWTLFNQTNQYENTWFFGKDKLVIFSISFHINYFKVHIQVILQQQINYFLRILRLIYGDLKLFIHFHQK